MQRRQFFKLSALALSLGFAGNILANAPLTLGKQYKSVGQVQPITPHRKHVVEVFYYGCSHCYQLEPTLNEWLKTKPSEVHFERVPAVLDNPNWVFMAKVYLTSQELGIIEKSHLAFFQALHRDKQPLFSIETIAKFHSQFGVSEQVFIDTFNSFKVDQQLRRAQKLTQAYAIEGVPSLIINGKYLTDLTMSGGHNQLWQNVNKLLEQ